MKTYLKGNSMSTNPYNLLKNYIEKEKSIKDFSENHLNLMFHVLKIDIDDDTKSIYIHSIGKELDLILSLIEKINNRGL